MPNSPAITLPPIDFALGQSRLWTALLLLPWFSSARNPLRSAEAFLKRQVARGLLATLVADAVLTELPKQPLASSLDSDFNADALAYRLSQRWSQAPSRIRVYWPTSAFARLFGSWTGTDSAPCLHKIGHDLLVTAVTLSYLRTLSAEAFLQTWTTEQKLQFDAKAGRWTGPLPDALKSDEQRITAVEIGGYYPADWIRHHVRRFERAGWCWEIW